MNKSSIDWPGLTHTLNPVSGCLRGCNKETKSFDCYACKLHTMRHEAYLRGAKLPERYKNPFNQMHYWPHVFKTVPKNPKKPTKVFIGSMSDIAYWEDEWIFDTIEMCKSRPKIEFMFCTKSPFVYYPFTFPSNCWLGCTITYREEKKYNFTKYKYMNNYINNATFLSIEPLLGTVYNIPASINLVIVGADSSNDPVIPKKEWISSINHPNIHYKENIKKYL